MKKILMLLGVIFYYTLLTIQNSFGQWEIQESETKENLKSVYFVDSLHGWAVGEHGIILKYNEKKWTVEKRGLNSILLSVYFTDSLHGWAVGVNNEEPYKGIMLKYIGNHWEEQPIENNSQLIFIYFTDSINGFAIGSKGEIFKYNMNKWNLEQSSLNYNVWPVFFTDINHGWAFSKGSGLKNDGKRWTEIGHINYEVNAIYFIDTLYGWAVTGGRILKWEGKQWLENANRILSYPSSVFFADINNGWAVGSDCSPHEFSQGHCNPMILKCNKDNWIVQQCPSTNALNAVFFKDKNNGWIVGEKGTILHTTNGGGN